MAERCADYDARLSAVMPADFKDWHQNGPKEWPEVAAGTIANLRERLEAATHSDLKFHHWTEQVDNAWPAIHRVLVAAREFADRRNNTFPQWAELWQALRALDDKEQGR